MKITRKEKGKINVNCNNEKVGHGDKASMLNQYPETTFLASYNASFQL